MARHVLSFTRPGDLVLDPFSGRGTTILESSLQNRRAIGTDVNLVAACVSGAKADIPILEDVINRLNSLSVSIPNDIPEDFQTEFFDYCFDKDTLREIIHLRNSLNWRECAVDRFIAAVALGVLHGESHRSPTYFSNRMPRTISTKPDYSIRWWKSHGLRPPRRAVFEILPALCAKRLAAPRPSGFARIALRDARQCSIEFPEFTGQVKLVVTSPPYLDTTDYSEDQWLRIWFLGGPSSPTRGMNSDDRHRNISEYWTFLEEVWSGVRNLLSDSAVIAVRIGGKKLSVESITDGLTHSLSQGLNTAVKLLDAPITSEIKNGQLNSFRPGDYGKKHEHDYLFRVS